MKTAKKIPERMCVSCREMKPKAELIRIVNSLEGVKVDLTGKMNGRGVYLCKSEECVRKALKNKGFVKQNGFSLEEVATQLESLIER